MRPACLISFRMVVFPQFLILDRTIEVPGRVHITAKNGVRSCLFTTARVATPSPVVVLVFSRRPDSSGSLPSVDGGKVGEYGPKCQRRCPAWDRGSPAHIGGGRDARVPRKAVRIRQDPAGDTHRGLASVSPPFKPAGRKSGSSGWTRTNNPSVNSRLLCRLSYRGSAGAGETGRSAGEICTKCPYGCKGGASPNRGSSCPDFPLPRTTFGASSNPPPDP